MFRWLIGASLEFRLVTVAIAAALVSFGVHRLETMPVDVLPEFDPPIVEIQTEAIGLSAQEMEDLVTLNLEELLSGVPWLESIRSQSLTGLSHIVLRFKRGTDFIRARQMVQERLALAIYLPNVAAAPQILQPVSSTRRLMVIGLSSDKVNPLDLSMIARWTIQPKLTGVSGVSNVSIWGQRLKQMQVQIDPRRLRDARVIQDDIIRAAGDALWVSPLTYLKGSTPGTGGWIDNPTQRLGVLHTMPIEKPREMAKVPVAPQHLLLKGEKMELGDVTEVTFGHPPLIGDGYVKGESGLVLVVEKFPSANTLEVTEAVDQAIRELRRGLPGVTIDTGIFRLASYVEDSIGNLIRAIVAGSILVVLMIGAFLFNWRTALISLISIPVSLLVAVVVLDWFGMTLNTMLLAGLVVALGVVIDDAIVGVDRFMERLRARGEGSEPSILRMLVDATLDSHGATLYGALVILLAVAPVFFMGGASGAFFTPLAAAYALAVIASLLVGLTLTPALTMTLFRRAATGRRESPVAIALQRGYGSVLKKLASAPAKVTAGGAIAVVAGLALWPVLGQSLLPAFKERTLVVNLATAPGTSHQETFRITARLGDELGKVAGVQNVGGHVGRAIMGDRVVGINSAQLWVRLDPAADYEQVLAAVRKTVRGYPGLDRSVQTYLRNTVSEALSGEVNSVVVRVFGADREILNRKAEEVRQALAGLGGLVDLRTVGPVVEPQIKVRVDLENAGKANVAPGEVRRSAATVFAGITVGFLYEEQKIFDAVVWSPPEVRHSIDDIRNILVEKSDRHHVRLGDVADVSIVPTPTVLPRTDISPYVDVVADVAGRDLASVNGDIVARLDRIKFPLEYHAKVLGEFAERQDAQDRTLNIAIASLIGICLLLQACFGSWRLALIGFLALPAAVAGGLVAVLIGGGVVSLGSLIGFFAVLGIAARNSILLITHFQRLESIEGVPFGPDLVVRGARERLPSLLASTAAIIAALLPLVILGQIAGLEIVQPIAVVIVGGVIASTLATLLLLPGLYLVLGRNAARRGESVLAENAA